MRPTAEEQLDGVRRLLEGIDGDETLSAASREVLRNAVRLVKRVRGAWAATLPFLVEDNARLARLLSELSEVVPGSPAPPGSVAAGASAAEAADVTAASARNTELRSMLARAIRELPDTERGHATRATVGQYLRWRAETDPT